jgi:hypothetical protein
MKKTDSPVPCGYLLQKSPANRISESRAAKCADGNCTKSGQGLVDKLHSIACKVDRVPRFSLTLKIGRVKRESFFDTF